MKYVYVVVGTSGEYSDRTEWCARVFTVEKEAQKFAEKLKINIMTWKVKQEAKPYEKRSDIKDHPDENIPQFYGLLNVDYTVCKVPFGPLVGKKVK